MTKRQRAHAARMRARRPIRPYDHWHREKAAASILRLRELFRMGMSDDFIANALSLDVVLVKLLRKSNPAKQIHDFEMA